MGRASVGVGGRARVRAEQPAGGFMGNLTLVLPRVAVGQLQESFPKKMAGWNSSKKTPWK